MAAYPSRAHKSRRCYVLDDDFAGMVRDRILAEAKRRDMPDAAAVLLTEDTIGLSHRRLTSAQAKGLAVQLIHENKTNAGASQDSPA
jgi:hypothetical protein